jgi:MSHA biogenesis protein MshO
MKIRTRSSGFTLVEAIVVMVIVGIVAGMVAVFIRAPIMGYRDAVDRAEITDQADLALRRMARDIRLALPNSVRTMNNGSALEFLQTRTGGRYLSVDDGIPGRPALDDQTQTSFTVLAPPARIDQVAVGDWVVVYNLGDGFAPSDAYAAPTAGNRAQVRAAPARANDATLGAIATIALDRNLFASQSPMMASPTYSFQVVSSAVSFYCEPQADGTRTLWRAWGYGINATQAIPAVGNGSRAVVATRLADCNNIFSYGSAATQRSGLVLLTLALQGRYPTSAPVRLVHQVHVDNTP